MLLDKIIAVRNNKTLYKDGELCVKVFSEDFPKSDVLNEALNQARVEETGLNIPKVKEVTKIDGKWAIISQFIKGKTMDRVMAENPDKKDFYIEKLVDLQLEVQSKICPLLPRLGDKMHGKIEISKIDATTRYDLHEKLNAMPKHDKLCHGDFNPSNIIITDEGEYYVLDWSHATQGNGSADAARTYLLFLLHGDASGAEKYLELFSKKSDTDKQYIKRWMPIVAASQSVKGNEKEREFLLSWVMDKKDK